MHAWRHTNVPVEKYNTFWTEVSCSIESPGHVATRMEICQQYVRYVYKLYGTPWVVFDRYFGGLITKDVVHRKWSVTYVGVTVQVSGSMVFKGKREDFLSNKHRFITLLKTPKCFHQLQHQPLTTAHVSTSKFSSGWDETT